MRPAVTLKSGFVKLVRVFFGTDFDNVAKPCSKISCVPNSCRWIGGLKKVSIFPFRISSFHELAIANPSA